MSHVARQSGGAFINLLRMSPEDACTAMCTAGAPLRPTESSGMGYLHLETRGGRIALVGRLSAAEGSVTLDAEGVPPVSFEVTAAAAAEGRSLARAWAGLEAQALSLAGDLRAAALEARSRRDPRGPDIRSILTSWSIASMDCRLACTAIWRWNTNWP